MLIIAFVAICIGLISNPKSEFHNNIVIPNAEDILSVQMTEWESKQVTSKSSAIRITDYNHILTLKNLVSSEKKIDRKSIQDVPLVDNYIKIELNKQKEVTTLLL
ncbi:DUF5301 domain-containing protein [Tissierella sp. MSJ-40]|uniref:DUF5301 domain-containing protein n=1 Tax=Tissierella simiarum TaxID=2841534 RepID=A0ABS6E1A4_9FIRM|nr:DUF5301 domain-containing protein [Tissierella simiarum]